VSAGRAGRIAVLDASDELRRGLRRRFGLAPSSGSNRAQAPEAAYVGRELRIYTLVSLRRVVLVKFGLIAAWLWLVTFSSGLVLAIHSFFGHLPFPLLAVTLASLVAWINALAFLGIVFSTSALAPRTAYAGIAASGMGLALFGALALLKINVSELAANLFAVDGAIMRRNALSDLCVGSVIACCALFFTLREVDRRRAT
jgi:hypothetical protein